MDAGIHGAHGVAAARLAVEASSRGRESVKGLSLMAHLAPVKRESRGVAMRRDVLVSDTSIVMDKGCLTITQSNNRSLIILHMILVTF